MSRSLIAWLFCVAVVGCGDDAGTWDAGPSGGGGDAAMDAGRAGVVELGVGTVGVEPVPSDLEVPLVFGPQGGFHVDVSVRLTELEPEGLVLRYILTDVETETLVGELARPLNRSRVTPDGDGGFVRFGDQAQFTEISRADEVEGREIEIVAEADPLAGATVTDRIVVIPVQ